MSCSFNLCPTLLESTLVHMKRFALVYQLTTVSSVSLPISNSNKCFYFTCTMTKWGKVNPIQQSFSVDCRHRGRFHQTIHFLLLANSNNCNKAFYIWQSLAERKMNVEGWIIERTWNGYVTTGLSITLKMDLHLHV